jgi:hypothetical protein
MPKPDDPANLNNNLYTIARLSQSPAGSKLSYDRGTGRFSIQMPHALQGLARTLSHDTVTREDYFGRPIRAVFAAAYPDRRQSNLFRTALDGLKTLRREYDGEKLAALDAVISDAEHGTRKEYQPAIGLREKYRTFLTFGFQQAAFLPESNDGICYSLAIDWGRRILFGEKVSFATSAKPAGAAPKGATLDAVQKARLMKKVDSRIRDLQAGITRYAGPTMEPRAAFRLMAVRDQFRQKYGNVWVHDAVSREHLIASDARGSGVLAAVRRAAGEIDHHGAPIFIANFKCKIGGRGHAIGIHLPGDGLHFFDPNLGEFWFPDSAITQRDAFLDDWWKMFYIVRRPGKAGEEQGELFPRGQFFESWKVERVGTA